MLKLKEDKNISRSESYSHYSKNIICCKWYGNKPVLFLVTNNDGMSAVSNVMRQTKTSAAKTPVSCRNIIKLYNNSMDGVDIMDKKTAVHRLVKVIIAFT